MEPDIIDEIKGFIRLRVVEDPNLPISDTEEIIRQGLIDSMGIMRLITHLQKLYGVPHFEYQDITLENFRTPLRIQEMLMKYLAAREDPAPRYAKLD
jgi:acyl carrier protein